MEALSRPFDPARPAHGPWVPFPLAVVIPFVLLGLAGLVLAALGGLPAALGRVAGVVGFHGGLLAASLAGAWSCGRGWKAPLGGIVACLGIAAGACVLVSGGCLAYLLVPVSLAVVAWREPVCRRLGLVPCSDLRALVLGGAVGVFLGLHLWLSASLSLGYRVRLWPASAWLGELSYDLGVSVLSAECFFRGTLFDRWQRRWGFWAGALGATALLVLRYLADPALPRTVGVTAGAVFYLAVLSLAGCALFWHSGSLIPSALASALFFSAYRMLDVR